MSVEWLSNEVDAARRSRARTECRELRGHRAKFRTRALEEKQPVVRYLREHRRPRLGAVPDAALVARGETGAVAQRRIPEWRREQIVHLSARDVWRLGTIDQ